MKHTTIFRTRRTQGDDRHLRSSSRCARASAVHHDRQRAIRKLLSKLKQEGTICACYEAGACGYEIYRQLEKLGIDGDVVAPSLIPKRSGDRLKTDRRDDEKLARLLRAGELTSIAGPLVALAIQMIVSG